MTDGERLTVRTNGRELDVWTGGPDEAPAVVFHMGSIAGLVPVSEHLFPRRQPVRMITYARPGYSRSTPHPGRTVRDGASDTAAVLDALGVDKFVAIGWSGGAPHALACSVLLPARCRATAVVAGIAPYGANAELRSWYEEIDEIKPLLLGDDAAFRATLDEQARLFAAIRSADVADLYPSPADKAKATGPHGEWLASIFRTAYESGSAGAYDDWAAFVTDWGIDVADTRHVAVWHGGEDRIPAAHPKWIAECSPGAKLRLFPDEGHCSLLLKLPEIIQDALDWAGTSERAGR